MDTLDRYRQIVCQALIEETKIRYSYGNIEFETIFDREADRYLLLIHGWDGRRRVHGCLIHVDIINGKIWIQRDGTENGIANELVAAGVPKQNIVLGFKSAELRKHTEFAAA
jgi:hypothetical protein